MPRGGKSLVDDLNRLIKPPAIPRPRLQSAPAVGPLSGRGQSAPVAEMAGTGNGIATPLNEPDYSKREFHPAVNLPSSDGVFIFEIEPLAALEMVDAASRPLRVQYAAPPPP